MAKISKKKVKLSKIKINVCPIVGAKKDLICNKLPTYNDILKYYLWLDKKKASPFFTICNRITDIWNKTKIPTILQRNILRRLKKYHQKYKHLTKQYKSRNNTLGMVIYCKKKLYLPLYKFSNYYQQLLKIRKKNLKKRANASLT